MDNGNNGSMSTPSTNAPEGSKPERKPEGYNAAQLIGTVLGPVAAPAGGILPLVLEVWEREQDDAGNWTDVDRRFNVAVTGARAEGLAKLENLEGARLFVDGVFRNGQRGGYIHARRVILLGGKKREEQQRPSAESIAGRF